MPLISLLDGFSCVARRGSARRPNCSLFSVFSFVASRVSARRPTYFLLLRQEKVSKEKASLSQGRCAVPCAARSGRVGRKLGCASNMRPPDPPAAALLSPVSMATHTNSRLRSLAFGIANSRRQELPPWASRPANEAAQPHIANNRAVRQCPRPRPSPYPRPSASAATRDTQSTACKVSASERARGSRFPHPAMRPCRAAQRWADQGGRMFEAQPSLRPTPPNASSAGNPAGARSLARLLFAYFLLAKQEKVSRLPGRNPACHATKKYKKEKPTIPQPACQTSRQLKNQALPC
jgi:hypothetical protein